jgi:hypothetical protein
MPGIFDPFAPPAPPKEKIPTWEEAMVARDKQLEKDAVERNDITLDGGSHALKFSRIRLDEIKESIGKLVKAVQDASPELSRELRRAGVFISNQAILDVDAHRLDTSSGIVHICDVPPGKGETKVYQRLAYALSGLPIKNILAAHKASIITRG